MSQLYLLMALSLQFEMLFLDNHLAGGLETPRFEVVEVHTTGNCFSSGISTIPIRRTLFGEILPRFLDSQ